MQRVLITCNIFFRITQNFRNRVEHFFPLLIKNVNSRVIFLCQSTTNTSMVLRMEKEYTIFIFGKCTGTLFLIFILNYFFQREQNCVLCNKIFIVVNQTVYFVFKLERDNIILDFQMKITSLNENKIAYYVIKYR